MDIEHIESEKLDCPSDSYYALGCVEGVFDQHLFTNEKEAEKIYQKEGCVLIKGWGIDCAKNESNCKNGNRLSKYWDKAQGYCEKIIKQINKGKSLAEILKKIPDELC